MTKRNTGTNAPVLVLFRHDLRLADNRALSAAAELGRPVLPVFILDEESPRVRPLGAARRWWLHHSLEKLSDAVAGLGLMLVLRSGAMAETVDKLIDWTGADTVYWNRRYEPAEIAVDTAMKNALRTREIAAESFDGALLHEPSQLKTGSGGPYKVYTPFWRALTAGPDPRDPVDAPTSIQAPEKMPASEKLSDWKLLPTHPDWAGGMRESWVPGEAAAHERLREFIDGAIDGYGAGRDIPGVDHTTRLSPYLASGEITPFQIFAAIDAARGDAPAEDLEKLRKEVAWREFNYHLLFHHPDLATKNYNSGFDAFSFSNAAEGFAAWKRGATGYPIVDAGMRQLWQTGWMHNRVRMIAASFLIKHLLVDWREGEKWFWDTLVDADFASNPANWQWVAGSGADASPYFRIFNPTLQGEKFDPDGSYIRQFVPELADLPAVHIHTPWLAPKSVLDAAGVKLGKTYPVPVIEHKQARARAMEAYTSMRAA